MVPQRPVRLPSVRRVAEHADVRAARQVNTQVVRRPIHLGHGGARYQDDGEDVLEYTINGNSATGRAVLNNFSGAVEVEFDINC